MPTIVGSAGNDRLVGTVDADLIEGLDGDDSLYGDAGNDILRGGAGNDFLDGGPGDDLIEGGDGDDYLSERQAESDTLRGGDGNDTIIVGAGGFFSAKTVSIEGGNGNDSLTLWGESQSASITVDMGDGDDRIVVREMSSTATIALGSGVDTLEFVAYSTISRALSITDFGTGSLGDRIEIQQYLSNFLTNWDQVSNPFATGHLQLAQQGANTVLLIDQDGGGDQYVNFLTFQNTSAASFTRLNLGGFPQDGSPLYPGETLTGTDASETINGTRGPDVIDGLGGDDRMFGAEGNDTLRGGTGNDYLDGGAGNDLLEGGDGDDTLVDTIGGDNILRGGNGNDTITDGAGNDVLEGGGGNDTLRDVEGGSDTVRGGDGNDDITFQRFYSTVSEIIAIDAGDGNDRLTISIGRVPVTVAADLGAGDDVVVIEWLLGNASVTLGLGQDVVKFAVQLAQHLSGAVTISDFVTGVSGDRLDLSGFLSSYCYNWDPIEDPFRTGHLRLLQQGSESWLQIDRNGGGDDFSTVLILSNTVASTIGAANLSTGMGVLREVIGTQGNDFLVGSSLADLIDGLGGDDDLAGLGGNDTLLGGAGNDHLDGGVGSDTLDGGDGNDILEYRDGGSDTLRGGGGDDTISLRAFAGASGDQVQVDAGDGNDTVNLEGSSAAIVLTLGAGRDTVAVGQFYPAASATAVSITDFVPGALGDRLDWARFLGSALTNLGYPTNPFASGHSRLLQQGADTLLQIDLNGGGDAYRTMLVFQNTISTAFTYDNFQGYPPDGSPPPGRTYDGTEGDDSFIGTPSADIMNGNGGNDYLSGEGGDDILRGGAGNDFLDGGLGNDVLEGGDGNDRLISGSGAETLRGGDGDDFIVVMRQAGSSADQIRVEGGNGADVLDASQQLSSARVFVDMGPGNDRAIGGAGDDVLTGGPGADALDGGPGNDLFIDTVANMAGDVISGFAHGDRIVLTDANFATFGLSRNGNVISFNGGSITFAGGVAGRFVAVALHGGGVEITLRGAASQDFNGDGSSDVLLKNADNNLIVWRGQSNSEFWAISGLAANPLDASWKVAGLGDFNGDGRGDVLWRHVGGEIGEWLGQAGVFANNGGAAANPVDNSWKVAGIGDFNGDGRDDIIWQHDSGEVGQWLGMASGGFANNGGAAANMVDPSWSIVGTADFNGDGRADVLWRHSSGAYAEWQGTASGRLVNVGPVLGGTSGSIVGTGDVDGDGRDDVVFRTSDGLIKIWLGQDSGQFNPTVPTRQISDLDWKIVSIGDFNGDGRSDLLWQHVSGASAEWVGTSAGDFLYGGPAPAIEASLRVQSPEIFLV